MRLKTLLLSVIVGLTLALGITVRQWVEMKQDRNRMLQNQNILLHNGRVNISETTTGNSMVSTQAITLKASEFRKSGDTLSHIARTMGVKPSRITHAATVSAMTHVEITAPVTHVVSPADSVRPTADTVVAFSYDTPWITFTGTVSDSVMQGSFKVADTLDIIVHRIPKRFLFFRFGCKAVRLNVSSRNPHTTLTYARYYQLVK